MIHRPGSHTTENEHYTVRPYLKDPLFMSLLKRVHGHTVVSPNRLYLLWQFARQNRHRFGDGAHFAEFGVYRGGSAFLIGQGGGGNIDLFDTFAGIPCSCPHDRHQVGDFDDVQRGDVKELMQDIDNVTFYVGDFTLLKSGDLKPYTMVHLDADQHESALWVLKNIYPHMPPGAMLITDDWLWPATPGVKKAFEEYFGTLDGVVETTGVQGMVIK